MSKSLPSMNTEALDGCRSSIRCSDEKLRFYSLDAAAPAMCVAANGHSSLPPWAPWDLSSDSRSLPQHLHKAQRPKQETFISIKAIICLIGLNTRHVLQRMSECLQIPAGPCTQTYRSGSHRYNLTSVVVNATMLKQATIRQGRPEISTCCCGRQQ